MGSTPLNFKKNMRNPLITGASDAIKLHVQNDGYSKPTDSLGPNSQRELVTTGTLYETIRSMNSVLLDAGSSGKINSKILQTASGFLNHRKFIIDIEYNKNLPNIELNQGLPSSVTVSYGLITRHIFTPKYEILPTSASNHEILPCDQTIAEQYKNYFKNKHPYYHEAEQTDGLTDVAANGYTDIKISSWKYPKLNYQWECDNNISYLLKIQITDVSTQVTSDIYLTLTKNTPTSFIYAETEYVIQTTTVNSLIDFPSIYLSYCHPVVTNNSLGNVGSNLSYFGMVPYYFYGYTKENASKPTVSTSGYLVNGTHLMTSYCILDKIKPSEEHDVTFPLSNIVHRLWPWDSGMWFNEYCTDIINNYAITSKCEVINELYTGADIFTDTFMKKYTDITTSEILYGLKVNENYIPAPELEIVASVGSTLDDYYISEDGMCKSISGTIFDRTIDIDYIDTVAMKCAINRDYPGFDVFKSSVSFVDMSPFYKQCKNYTTDTTRTYAIDSNTYTYAAVNYNNFIYDITYDKDTGEYTNYHLNNLLYSLRNNGDRLLVICYSNRNSVFTNLGLGTSYLNYENDKLQSSTIIQLCVGYDSQNNTNNVLSRVCTIPVGTESISDIDTFWSSWSKLNYSGLNYRATEEIDAKSIIASSSTNDSSDTPLSSAIGYTAPTDGTIQMKLSIKSTSESSTIKTFFIDLFDTKTPINTSLDSNYINTLATYSYNACGTNSSGSFLVQVPIQIGWKIRVRVHQENGKYVALSMVHNDNNMLASQCTFVPNL